MSTVLFAIFSACEITSTCKGTQTPSDWICSDAGFNLHGWLLDRFLSDRRPVDWICSDGWVRVGFPACRDWICSVTYWYSTRASTKLTDFAPTEGPFTPLGLPVISHWLTLLRFSARFSAFDWLCSDGRARWRVPFSEFLSKSPHSADWILPFKLTEHAPTCAWVESPSL